MYFLSDKINEMNWIELNDLRSIVYVTFHAFLQTNFALHSFTGSKSNYSQLCLNKKKKGDPLGTEELGST